MIISMNQMELLQSQARTERELSETPTVRSYGIQKESQRLEIRYGTLERGDRTFYIGY